MNAKVFLIAALGLWAALAARAQTELYPAREWSLDAIGSYATHNRNGGDGAFGLGLGVNYFFTQNLGAGVDTYADAFKIPYMINMSGIYRYPLNSYRLAPYGFGGVGRQWKYSAQWAGHLGLGIEYNLRPRSSVFFDIREVFPAQTRDYTVLRIGFRFGFK